MSEIPNVLDGWDVLVVDDEEDSLMVASMMLEMAGAVVRTAENGRVALELVHQQRPKFILADISMPEMDGWQLIQELQRDRSTLEIPVIALTAHAMSGDREKAIAAGFTNYLSKPLDPDKFIFQLLNLLTEIPGFQDLVNSN